MLWACQHSRDCQGLTVRLVDTNLAAMHEASLTEFLMHHMPAAMGLLRRWNRDSPVIRIENVPSYLGPELERLGYRLTPKVPDYLYRATDLAALAGDRYKSQRSLCNRFEREQSFEMDSYEVRDRQDCRALLEDWSQQKQAEGLEAFGVMLLADAVPAHEIIWSQASALRRTG